jgi:hypothetical protein
MICLPRGGCWRRCSSVLSWASAMICRRGSSVQLRLELAESPAPAVALWELVGEQQRQGAIVLMAALLARAVEGVGSAGEADEIDSAAI